MDSSKKAGDLEEPLTEISAAAAPSPGSFHSLDLFLGKLASCLLFISLCSMAYSAVTALIYHSKNDPVNLAVVAGSLGSFSFFVLLFLSILEFERTRGSPSWTKHIILKAIIWVLSVTLNTVVSRRVTTIVDSLALDVFVWTFTALTSACGFFFLFVY